MTTSIISDIRPASVVALIVLLAAIAFIVLCFTYLIKNLPPKAAIWGLIGGIVIAAGAVFVLLSPRQPVALFAPGEGTGAAEALQSAGEDGVLKIRVREDRIYLAEQALADASQLQARLQEMEGLGEMTVILTDDYASAAAFHEAEETLDALDLTWQTERLD